MLEGEGGKSAIGCLNRTSEQGYSEELRRVQFFVVFCLDGGLLSVFLVGGALQERNPGEEEYYEGGEYRGHYGHPLHPLDDVE